MSPPPPPPPPPPPLYRDGVREGFVREGFRGDGVAAASPRYGFEYEDGRVWSGREDVGPALLEYSDVVYETTGAGDDDDDEGGRDGYRRRRYHHHHHNHHHHQQQQQQLRMGNFNDIVENMGFSQEVLLTPKQKAPRMSALLRVQIQNPTKNWKDEGSCSPRYFNGKKRKDEGSMLPGYHNAKKWKDQGLSSAAAAGCFDDGNVVSSKSKGPVVVSDRGPEEVRESSPVELDVSFKSNALVAKAITNPFSPTVGPLASKVELPALGLSSSKVSPIHDGQKNGGKAKHTTMSVVDKTETLLKDEVVVTETGAANAAVSRPCPSNVNLPCKQKTVVKPSSITSVGVKRTVRKKKKVVRRKLNMQNESVTKVSERDVNGVGSMTGVGGGIKVEDSMHGNKSDLDRSAMSSIDKVSVSEISSVNVALSQPSLNNVKSAHQNVMVAKSAASATAGSKPPVKKKKKMIGKPVSGLQSASTTKVPKGVVDGNGSVVVVGATTGSKKCLIKSKGTNDAENGKAVDNVSLTTSQSGDPPRKSSIVGKSSPGTSLLPNGICTPKASVSNAITSNSNFSGKKLKGNIGETVNLSSFNTSLNSSINSDKGVGEKKVTDSDSNKVRDSGPRKGDNDDLQSSHQVTALLDKHTFVKSLSNPIVSYDKLSDKKKVASLDSFPIKSNSRTKAVPKKPVNAESSKHYTDASLNSGTGLGKSTQKVACPSNGTTTCVSLVSKEKNHVSVGKCVGKQSLSSPVESIVASNVKKKKKIKKKKKKMLLRTSNLASSTMTNTLKEPVNKDSSKPGVSSVMSFDNGVTQSDGRGSAPITAQAGKLDSNSSNGLSLSLENGERVDLHLSLSTHHDEVPSVDKHNGSIHSFTGFLNSRTAEFSVGTLNAEGSTAYKCIVQSREKDIVSETDLTRVFHFLPLDGSSVSPASKTTADLLLSPVANSNDITNTKEQNHMECSSRIRDVHDGSLSMGGAPHLVDSAYSSRKDLADSVDKFSASVSGIIMGGLDSQPLPTSSSLLENNDLEPPSLSLSVGFDQKCRPTFSKKEDPLSCLLCLSSAQATIIHERSTEADKYKLDVNSASISGKCVTKSAEIAIGSVSGNQCDIIISSHPAHALSASRENGLEGGSSMFMVLGKDSLKSVDGRKYVNQSMESCSFVESASPSFNCPLELEGSWRKDLNQISTGEKNEEYTLQNDMVQMGNDREREEKLEIEKGEHQIFGEEICEDIGLVPVAQERRSLSVLEVQTAQDGRSFNKPLENEVHGSTSQNNLLSLPTFVPQKLEASSGSVQKSNGEDICFLLDSHTDLDSHESMSISPETNILSLGEFHDFGKVNHKKIGSDGNPSDSKDYILNAKWQPSDPEVSVKSNESMQNVQLIPKKALQLQSMESGKSYLNNKVGNVIGRKTYQASHVPRVLPGRTNFHSGSVKETAALTHITKPRTWRRTDNAILPQQQLCLSTGSLQSDLQKKFANTQSTSYIRKGNSLVRKGAQTASLPMGSVRLDPVPRYESKKNVVAESNDNCLRKDFEKSKTPSLPETSGSSNSNTNSSQVCASYTSVDPLLKGGLESTPDPMVVAESSALPESTGVSDVQSGLSKKLVNGNISNNGKSTVSETRKITYVKHKSHQLVASQDTEIDHNHLNTPENVQTLTSLSSCDQYYKKKKNQLIRSSSSWGSHLKKAVAVPDDSSNSESQMIAQVSSMKCSKSTSKRRNSRALTKICRPSKFSLVWTLNGQASQVVAAKSSGYQQVFPLLFPWKRTMHWRNGMSNSVQVSKKTSLSLISKKLLFSRKRNTVYTRSAGGFSLRKSKVLSIGGSNLKWSKSIETRSKKINEEATRAVASVQRKKQDQKGTAHAVTREKIRSKSSGERIYRIGSVRYKMDSSRRTLQRIPDEKSSSSVGLHSESGKDDKRSFIPKRLLIGNNEYIRIGNGNQLVRDPKKRVRILASEKVRWSLHTARMRVAKKQQYCQFFTRFGKCNKIGGKCPYIHDPAKVAVCTKFLKGTCTNSSCKLTHKVIPERMQDCSYFLQGLCSNENCPYRHVNVNPNASVCEGFLRGYCANGDECRKKHTYVCPVYESTGVCPQGSMCKLHHPKTRNKSRKRKRSDESKNSNKRYFGSRIREIDEVNTVPFVKPQVPKSEDIFFLEGRLADYVSLDFSSEEDQVADEPMYSDIKMSENEPSDMAEDQLGELIKPVRIMK
ncbi:hypothetical protein Syun_003336 [Stephania yunnanensis]|uniref:C3H1-type domain-containing protein n=1 Tax=Stephania yunnanensis TaxID=152371 RepID=A0AAP0L4U4_9MAGN